MSHQWRKLRQLASEEEDKSWMRIEDEDPLVSIERRLEEIRLMAKPRRQETNCLDSLSEEQRDLILKYKELPIQTLHKSKRKGWKLKDKFCHAARIILLLVKCFNRRKKYYLEKPDSNQIRRRGPKKSESNPKAGHTRSSLAQEMQLALITQPHLRDTRDVRRVMWLLKAIKAFKALFPAEMERELAKLVSYEKYDDGRMIACQGRAPDRFYYIITGRVAILRQYQLSTGHVTKGMGFLIKGMTTDAEEMDKQWMREDSLVAKGNVEVLILDKKAFSFLQHTTVGPPVEFLRSLHLFEEFPVERFLKALEAIEYKYYGQGKIIVKDSNRTPWLHVVKSGQVKVVRRQTVVDAHAANADKFTSPRIEHLGCGKYFSHAQAMLGTQAKQKKMKRMNSDITLPQIGSNKTGVVENQPTNSLINGIEINISTGGSETASISPPFVYRQNSPELNDNMSVKSHKSKVTIEPLLEKSEDVDQEEDRLSTVSQSVDSTNIFPSSQKIKRKDTAFPVSLSLNIPLKGLNESQEDFQPHNLWLTRERTEADSSAIPRRTKEPQLRRAHLQLDILNPGDVFGLQRIFRQFLAQEGLDHMQPALASEPKGVALLSDGAEVIKINKRFFLQNADNNTMLKVETMYKEYISEDEAKEALYEKETWTQYKEALWDRMTKTLPQISSTR